MTNEELEQEVKRLEEQIKNLKVKLEEKAEEKCFLPYVPYEVEVPENINDYYYIDEFGNVRSIRNLTSYFDFKKVYKRGLAFKTEEEAKQYDRERMLIKKLKDWAKEYNGDWTPNWKDIDEEKKSVGYDNENEKIAMFRSYKCQDFSKLPYFISDDTAQQFIEEFGEEIKEVLC